MFARNQKSIYQLDPVKMDKSTLHPDLEWITNKATYKQVFDLFYTLGKVRYATFKQLHALNFRVATKTNLVRFIELDYLSNDNPVKAYSITDKTKKILELERYNTKLLQTKLTGQTLEHALKITGSILKLKPWTVFYPQFKEPPDYQKDWLKPDACLIFKKDNQIKIQFLEVEEIKQDWENYLLGKREKYERLATDANLFFMWWKHQSEKLGLPMGNVEDFCFSVCVVGNIKFNWEGFCFEN